MNMPQQPSSPAATAKSHVARGQAARLEIPGGNRKVAQGTEDILAQLRALTPAGAHGAAYA